MRRGSSPANDVIASTLSHQEIVMNSLSVGVVFTKHVHAEGLFGERLDPDRKRVGRVFVGAGAGNPPAPDAGNGRTKVVAGWGHGILQGIAD
jgi:hypothetical protein